MSKAGRKPDPTMYCAYLGDELLGVGTREELARIMGTSAHTVGNYVRRTRKRRAAGVDDTNLLVVEEVR